MDIHPSRVLKTFDTTAMVIGSMVGSGIFLLVGYAAAPISGGWNLMIAWVLGGMMALCGTMTTAELASQFPHTGGDFLYLRRIYGRYPAFLYGWMSLAIFESGSIGILALGSAEYAFKIFHGLEGSGLTVPLFASSAIIFYTLLHSLRVTVGARFQSILTVMKVVGILILTYLLFTSAGAATQKSSVQAASSGAIEGMARALVPVFFAYTGWNVVGYIAGEVKNPRKNLPIALVVGTSVTLLLYLLLNGAFLSVLGVEGMKGDPVVPVTALEAISAGGWKFFLSILIFVSIFSSLSIAVQSGARVVQSMGENGVFFEKVATIHPRWRTPVIALSIQGAWSVLLVHLLDLENLVNSTTVVMVLFSALTISTIFRARRTFGNSNSSNEKRFKTPLFPVIPVLYIGACLFIAVGVIQFYLSQHSLLPVWGFLFLVVGSIVYLIWRKMTR